MDFVFIDDDGAVIGSGSFLTQEDADFSIAGMGSAIPLPESSEIPGEDFFWDGISFQLRPRVPVPAVDEYGYRLIFDDPPPGLMVKVYDTEIVPPFLLYDGPVEAPDARIFLVDPSHYRLDFTAPFPHLPRTLNVSVPISEPLDA